MNPYDLDRLEPLIGLSVQLRLRTQAKLFSAAPMRRASGESSAPNTQTHPLDLAHPGTLPVLNRRALELALRLGLATGCEVVSRPAFVREHLTDPGVPKGYRLTQREAPLCHGGGIDMPAVAAAQGDGQPSARRVRLRRIHLEEETGTIQHTSDGAAGVDFNRAGVPLMHVVTERDLRSPREAVLLLEKLQRLVRYLDVSDARGSDGSMRCDATLALRLPGGEREKPSVQVTQLRSAEELQHALRYEIGRLTRRRYERAENPEARQWDAETRRTRPALGKTEASPDRFLPDPDLPSVEVSESLLKAARTSMPEQPEERRRRLADEFSLPPKAVARLTEDRALADFYEATTKQLYKLTGGGNTRRQAQRAAHFLLTEGRRALSQHHASVDALPVTPQQAAKVVYLLIEEDLPDAQAAGKVFADLLSGKTADDPAEVARRRGVLEETGGREVLEPIIEEMLQRHSKNVHRYKSGKKELMKSFVGEVRSEFEDQHGEGVEDDLIRELIEEQLH